VEPVIRGDVLAGIKIEPLLALCVPRNRERLKTAAREGDEILLKRCHTKRMRDLEVSRHAVGALGVDEEAAVIFEKACGDIALLEKGLVEVA
jgi:hypothetical protein